MVYVYSWHPIYTVQLAERNITVIKEVNYNGHLQRSFTFVTSKHLQSIIQQDFLGISYKDSYIFVSNSEKLLGVTIDNTLSWSTQGDSVINKCYTYLLSRIKSCVSVGNRKLFYNACILPHFNYCCIILGNCNAALEDRLVRFQNELLD